MINGPIIGRKWAIRHKASGFYLPEGIGYQGRGTTFREPSYGEEPKLYNTLAGAKRGLTAWLQGKHFAQYDYEDGYKYVSGTRVIAEPHRKREHMEIVEVHFVPQLPR